MRSTRDDQMTLGAFFHPTGNHVAAWLHPDAQIDAGVNFEHYVAITRMAEAAKFDLIFIADAAATRDGDPNVLSRWPQYMAFFEPPTLMAALAAVTSRIGLVATATTSYNEPYSVARRFASLDHISHGRAGWNVVTSSNQSEAFNFGRDAHWEHGARYARAAEFVEVVKGLWDSWEDDAFVRDRTTARYFDPAKLHPLNHHGQSFHVRGPLNVARPPQGYPVISQAGSSEAGVELAAQTAEIVFAPLLTLEAAKAFYGDLKGRMPQYGRGPDSLRIVPGLNPIVGRTEQEAIEKHRYLQNLIHPDVGRALLSAELDANLSDCDIDGPLPYDRLPRDTNASKSALDRLVRMAREQSLTIRQLYMLHAGARGQRTVIGTAEQIADDMEHWFLERGVDGFLIHPAYLPGSLEDFTTDVVPELQRRGLFRTDYSGATLRDHLGLRRPPSRHAK